MAYKKINIHLEFEEFKKGFLDKFLDSHNFYNELEEAWQEENGFGEEKDEESEGIHLECGGDNLK